MNKNFAEGISDAFLFLVITLPTVLSFALAPFCSGWNEGSMSGTCTIEILGGLYDFLSSLMLLLAFGGIIFILPFVCIAAITSTIFKFRRYKNGYRPETLAAAAKELVYGLPLFLIAYQMLVFFYIV